MLFVSTLRTNCLSLLSLCLLGYLIVPSDKLILIRAAYAELSITLSPSLSDPTLIQRIISKSLRKNLGSTLASMSAKSIIFAVLVGSLLPHDQCLVNQSPKKLHLIQ